MKSSTEFASVRLRESGVNRRAGNLLGVQAWMTPADYTSDTALMTKLSGYLEAADRRGWLTARTIVVFPEYLGTWLVVAGLGRAVTQASRLSNGLQRLVFRRPARVFAAWLATREQDRLVASVFRSEAKKLARAYQSVFSHLALTFGVTVVAGSTVLPNPQVRDGKVIASHGPLYGVSAVFAPDGRAHPQLVHKAYPTPAELPFLTPGSPSDLPVFETPAGRLGVLICADAWYPEPYDCLHAQEVDLLAVPSYAAKKGCWREPWHGYDGAVIPEDVDPRDVGRLTEAGAWRIYALTGRISSSGARAGINVFMSGALWDLGAEGASLMVAVGEPPVEVEPGQPALLNLWV